ncbi:hypothetical protein [Paraliobacillus ryukyuensis]|uniref:hypothetical protein n=1 Tax=Paraliobacillus ryukyuensis TaxID=200904 RepID=UPI0009A55E15|nr:hypothetical protein [Paraliobacillus ryukyuensis]
MDKAKIFIFIGVCLLISVFINIALGFNVADKSTKNKELSEEIDALKDDSNKLSNDLTTKEDHKTINNLTENDTAKDIVKEFFYAQYDYNSDSYKSRFDKIKSFVNDDVYGQLTAAGVPDVPNITFENRVNDIKMYLTAKNNILSGLVLLETVYLIEGAETNNNTQIFRLEVSEVEGSPRITKLENLGSFSSVSNS